MWNYDMEFAGGTAESHHLMVVKRPDIPAPVIDYTEKDIPGVDGKYYIRENTVQDIVIPIEFNFMGYPKEWFSYFREAKSWLFQRGINALKFGDDTEYFYKVKKVEIGTAERLGYEIGKFTANFYCSGYNYRIDGTEEYDAEDVQYNPYEICRPVYCVRGNGTFLMEVNGKKFSAEVRKELYIDTERWIAYDKDKKICNEAVTGDYEDMYINPGENSISKSRGFELIVRPNWRCL